MKIAQFAFKLFYECFCEEGLVVIQTNKSVKEFSNMKAH